MRNVLRTKAGNTFGVDQGAVVAEADKRFGYWCALMKQLMFKPTSRVVPVALLVNRATTPPGSDHPRTWVRRHVRGTEYVYTSQPYTDVGDSHLRCKATLADWAWEKDMSLVEHLSWSWHYPDRTTLHVVCGEAVHLEMIEALAAIASELLK